MIDKNEWEVFPVFDCIFLQMTQIMKYRAVKQVQCIVFNMTGLMSKFAKYGLAIPVTFIAVMAHITIDL